MPGFFFKSESSFGKDQGSEYLIESRGCLEYFDSWALGSS